MCFLPAHHPQCVIAAAQTHSHVTETAQPTRDPARDFASRQQPVRAAQREFDNSAFIPAGRTDTYKAQTAPKAPVLQVMLLGSTCLKENSNIAIPFVVFTYSLRGEHFPPHLFPLRSMLHQGFSLLLRRDFSNTIFTEVDWVKLSRLPQVIWKTKQCIDKIYTLNLNIAYL